MLALRGDVRLQIENPYEMPRRRYVQLRKYLAEQANDLEIPFEEIDKELSTSPGKISEEADRIVKENEGTFCHGF